jgi:hypothetical protein
VRINSSTSRAQSIFVRRSRGIPSRHVDYKNSKIKQYHKESRALRTETTINNTRDFAIGKRLVNLPALRQIGLSANRRLLNVQRLSHDATISEDAFRQVNETVVVNGQRGSALRFADPQSRETLLEQLRRCVGPTPPPLSPAPKVPPSLHAT